MQDAISVQNYIPYLLEKDAVATIMFRSGKMQHLFKGGYHSRYACTHIIVCIIYTYIHSVSVASQVNEALCFDYSKTI